MKIKYNTNNGNGAQAEQLKIESAAEAVDRWLAESIGNWGDDVAAFDCPEDEQADDISGDHVVLTEVCE